jgi:hypothetical protein
VNISSFSSNATPSLSAGDSVNISVDASTISGTPVYYKFFYCAEYGTANYQNSEWKTVQEYSSVSSCRYVFPDTGNYIVVARAVTDPSHEPAALPIFGGVISVNGGSGTDASDSTADAILGKSQVTKISLNGDSITVNGSGATASGSTVTIASAGSYRINGTLSNGMIAVDTKDKAAVEIILNGINISNSSTSPFYVKNAESTVIVLEAGTNNSITDGSSYVFEDAESDEPNAAMFSKDAMTICGTGSLTVDGKYNDGITSKDGLTIINGKITVNAVDDGIRGKDFITVKGGTVNVIASGDGLKSDNDEDTEKGYIAVESGVLNVVSGADGLDAQTDVAVTGGTLNITSGGGSSSKIAADASAKAVKGTASVTVDGGTFNINSADDAVHSNGSITVNGGKFSISTGDDGFHADTALTFNGGDIGITKSYEGIESAVITINSGNIRVVSSDDGINVAGGNDGSGTIPGPGMGGTGTTGTGGTTGGVIPGSGTTGGTGSFPGSGTTPPGNGTMPGGTGTMPGTGIPQGNDSFASTGNYFLYINGGYITVNSGGDGVDVNGSIEMTDGVLIVNGPTANDNAAIDYDGYFNIKGGFLAAAGSSGMAQAPGTSSTQNSLLLNLSSAKQAGTIIHIQTSAGTEVLTLSPSKTYQSVVFSSPELVTGGTFEVYVGGSSTGTFTDSLYQDGSYTPGTKYTNFTVAGIVTSIR